MRQVFARCSVFAAVASLMTASAALANGPAPWQAQTIQELGLKDATFARLSGPLNEWKDFSISTSLGGQAVTIDFEPHSIRSDDFMLIVIDEKGAHPTPPPMENTYRGTVRGIAGSYASASVVNGTIQAMIQVPGLETYWIQPAATQLGGAAGMHAVYAQSQAIPTGDFRCGVPDNMDIPLPALKHMLPDDTGGSTDAPLICELGVDTDFEFYQKNGSNVTTTITDISNVVNNCSTIYTNDANVAFVITHFIVRTAAAGQPYTSTVSDVLLGQFASEWSSKNGGIRRDLAHLFTGKAINGNVIGIAYLNAVCSMGIGYGLSESKFTGNMTFRTALTAHEVGHNFSGQHCDSSCAPCTIMCSGIGGCAQPLTNFGCSATGIKNYAAGRPCMTVGNTAPSPLAVPFLDLVPSAPIDTNKWTVNYGALASVGGNNEPSPQFSINLDSTDSLISVWLDTKTINTTPVFVSFFSQHVGVPQGQSLSAEYYNATSNLFQQLGSVPSDGVDQTTFAYNEFKLPSTGISNTRSRLRFAVNGASNLNDWFIDNVSVSIYCRTDINKDRALTIDDFVEFQTAFALGDAATADFTDDGQLTIDDFIAFQTLFAIGCY